MAYLGLADDDFEVIVDDTTRRELVITDTEGRRRSVRMPQVLMVRAAARAARGTP